MATPTDPLESLLAALHREGEIPPTRSGWDSFAARHLAPDETVLLALRGNGFTIWNPMILVTDRRVAHFVEAVFVPRRLRASVPATDIVGAEFRRRFLWGPVIIHTRQGRRIWVRSDGDADAQRFVDGVNRLVHGRDAR